MLSYPQLGYDIPVNGMELLKARYLFRDLQTKEIIETPSEMFQRVADCISSVEKTSILKKKWKKVFYNLMSAGLFLPNTPALLNAGRKNKSTLSACFVIGLEDKISGGPDSLFGAIELLGKLHQWGSGTGCTFAKIRQKGSIVSSTGQVASGPVSFMGNFNEAIESVMQGGFRRGAHMSILLVNHPDIIEFIECKNKPNERSMIVINRLKEELDLDADGEFLKVVENTIVNTQLSNMNISVAINKEFKDALASNGEYNLVEPHTGKIVGREKASRVFDIIVHNAWLSGEPGIVDLERANRNNPLKNKFGELQSTNPCGETFLYPGECCNLGSIVLPRMLMKNKYGKNEIDYKLLRKTIFEAVRFLDNVIDAQQYPHKFIEIATKKTRKIGPGIMGYADMLILLGVSYGSDECIEFTRNFMSRFREFTEKASHNLAKEKGNFPAWKDSNFMIPMRNAEQSVVAPTGSIAGIAGVSFGIEPLLAVAYRRKVIGREFVEVNPVAKEMLEKRGLWNSSMAEKLINENEKALPDDMQEIFKTAHNVLPEEHVEVLSCFQEYVSNSVSKTINLKNSATEKDVERIFKLAIEKNCKGITVYRDGSRQQQVMSYGKNKVTESLRLIRDRPRKLNGATYERNLGKQCGKLFIIINTDNKGYPFELFVEAGKSGGCLASQVQALGRLVSLMWRSNLGISEIVKQLKGITCFQAKPSLDRKETRLSCSDVVARTIEEHFLEDEEDKNIDPQFPVGPKVCSKCQAPLVREGAHCLTCIGCLDSKCS